MYSSTSLAMLIKSISIRPQVGQEISVANEVEEYISTLQVPIKVAVLGCAVNGPGEAREADIGIAGARGEGLLFRKGQVVRKVPEETMVEELKKEIDVIAAEMAAEREKEKETQEQ